MIRGMGTGDFAQGSNYLSFVNTDGCIDAVQQLPDNPWQVAQIKETNKVYYRNYLKPDRLVGNSLEIALKTHLVKMCIQ